MRWIRTLAVVMAASGLLALGGCGGGGGGSTGTLHLYMMDVLDDQYAQVWTTVYRVQIGNPGGGYQTVFEETEGVELNLPELASTAGYFGAVSVPVGTYTRARVTLRNTMRLSRRNGASDEVPLRVGAGSGFEAGAAGLCTAEFPVDLTVSPNGEVDLAVDFDLANFEMQGGLLQARIRAGDQNQLRARAKHGRLIGIVANLNPSTGFDLRLTSGRMVPVMLTSSTSVVSATTGAEATLANGQRVFVFGDIDPATRTVTATLIVVLDVTVPPVRPAHVRGRVVSVDPTDKSFVVEPLNVFMGFRPVDRQVKVRTNDATVFTFVPRAPASFGDVQVDTFVDALGNWDAADGSILARRVLIVRPS